MGLFHSTLTPQGHFYPGIEQEATEGMPGEQVSPDWGPGVAYRKCAAQRRLEQATAPMRLAATGTRRVTLKGTPPGQEGYPANLP